MRSDNGADQVKAMLGNDPYWNLSGAMFAYLFGNLAVQGIQVIGESQLIGYPSQFPSVSMVNWTTGAPNARFRVLELLHDNFMPGDTIVHSTTNVSGIYAQGFVTPTGSRKILLVNKLNSPALITIPTAVGAHEEWVDQVTADKRPALRTLHSQQFHLGGLGVAVITLRQGSR